MTAMGAVTNVDRWGTLQGGARSDRGRFQHGFHTHSNAPFEHSTFAHVITVPIERVSARARGECGAAEHGSDGGGVERRHGVVPSPATCLAAARGHQMPEPQGPALPVQGLARRLVRAFLVPGLST